MDGKPLPPSMTKDLKLAFIKPNAAVLASPREFTPHGQMRHGVLGLYPAHRVVRRRHLPGAFDVHGRVQPSSRAAAAVHRTACSSAVRPWARGRCTGWAASRRTCRDSWCSARASAPAAAPRTSRAASCPRSIRALLPHSGDPILYLSQSARRHARAAASEPRRADRDLNEEHFAETGDTEIASRISSYELAFRMQTAGPELLDFSKESPATLDDVWSQQRAHEAVRRPIACWRAGWSSAAFAS